MKGFIFTDPSIADVSQEDVKELINKKSTKEKGIVLIEETTIKELALLSYKAQSAHKVGIYLFSIPLKKEFDQNEFEEEFKQIYVKEENEVLKELIPKTKSFGVVVENTSKNDNISSVDVAASIGGILNDEFKKQNSEIKVQLKQPQLQIFSYITDEKCYLGIDLAGIALVKRPYKLLAKSSSVNGPFAYALLKKAGLKKDTIYLDPFAGSGTLVIEAALYQENKSCFTFKNDFIAYRIPKYKEVFEKVRNDIKKQEEPTKKKNIYGFDYILKIMMSAKKNAKIAGVLDTCNFSKVDVEWLDSKFEEGEVELIVTNPPKESAKKHNEKDIRKLYDELFYQARFVLSKKGKLAILTNKTGLLEELAKRHGFTKLSEEKLYGGQQPYFFIQFKPPQYKPE